MVKLRGAVWYVRVETKDGSGKRVQKWVRLPDAKNERQAKKEEARLITEIAAGTFIDPSKQTVAQYLEKWLVGLKGEARHTANTLALYEGIARRYAIPRLGSIPLAKLATGDIRAFLAELRESGRVDGEGGLATKTLLLVFILLKAALRQAVEDRLLLRNPMDGMKSPKPPKKDMTVLDEAQTVALLAAAKDAGRGISIYLPLLVLATTGLRRNECLALRWQDLDLERGLLTVNQALEQIIGEGVTFKPPKNDSSRRTIKMPPITVEALREHREEQFARRQELGEAYEDLGLVFERGDGTPIRPTVFSGAFARLARRQGLPGVHVHSLRHGHISQLIAQRAPMKAISDRAGHANIQTTMNLYGHLLPTVGEEVVEQFDAVFRAAMEKTGSNG